MTVVRRSSCLLLCLPLLASLCKTSDAAVSAMIQAISCSTPGSYSPSGAYAASLNQFLAELPEKAVSRNGGFFNGTVGSGLGTVYGLAMCSAGYSRADCGSCLAATSGSNTGGLTTRCPGSTTVLAVFDMCLVRYSNTNFLGTAETDMIYNSSAGEKPALPLNYSGEVYNQLQLLTGEAVSSPQRFAAGTADPPYALTQCTWDLPPDKCKQCLDVLSKNATTIWVSMLTQGERKSYSCTVRYSNTNFTVVPFQDVSSSGPLPPTAPPASTSKSSRTIAVATGSSVSAVGVAVLLGCCVWRARSRSQHNTHAEDEPAGQIQETTPPPNSNANMGQNQATTVPSSAARVNGNNEGNRSKGYVPRAYTYEELAVATSNFAKEKKLGNGAFGTVYEGRLPDVDMAVAIKEMIRTWSADAKVAFGNEIEVMRHLRHGNVLRLLGWCEQGEHMLLVYEIMVNGNLEERLYPRTRDGPTASLLGWGARLDILVGISSGLHYLHRDCGQSILHRDIKPANIMLDKNFNAKLADFGLVTQMSHTLQTSHPTEIIIGTLGYIDPAYKRSGEAREKSDIYSLGVILLEVACGERPTILQPGDQNRLIEKVRRCESGSGENSILDAADRVLKGVFDKQITAVLKLGLSCVETDMNFRPHIKKVMHTLLSIKEILADGAAASTSHSNGDEEASNGDDEEFSACREQFTTRSNGDQEASRLLAQGKGKMPASSSTLIQ